MNTQGLPRYDCRQFVQSSIVTGLGLSLFGANARAESTPSERPLFTQMGINAPLSQAAAVHAAGADFLLLGVRKFLVPQEPEAEFEKQLRLMEKSPIPVLGCNSFLTDGELRSVGPAAKHKNVLRYAKITFQRAKRAGVERIVFGSSKSRGLPEGWSKAQADEQFISLLTRMAELAEAEGITVAIENLRRPECNYLTRIEEVAQIVNAVDHPNIRILADLFHGSIMKDPPEVLQKYAPLIDMVEIAVAKGRAAPGVNGQDFRPYFRALRAGGYKGSIQLEARWKIDQVAKAFATIREQSAG